jgi:hypothetical protein
VIGGKFAIRIRRQLHGMKPIKLKNNEVKFKVCEGSFNERQLFKITNAKSMFLNVKKGSKTEEQKKKDFLSLNLKMK